MSTKKNIKHQVKYCLLCGKEFESWDDKNIHRIKPNKRNSIYNTVVLCSDCKYYIAKSKIKIYDCIIPRYCSRQYFSCFSKQVQKEILFRLRSLRNLFIKKE